MAIVTNTFTTFDAKGIREDLSNIITNIAPEETPYMSNIGRESNSELLIDSRPIFDKYGVSSGAILVMIFERSSRIPFASKVVNVLVTIAMIYSL